MTKFDESKFEAQPAPTDGSVTQEVKIANTVSVEEIKDIVSVPAVYVNKFYLNQEGGMIVKIIGAEEQVVPNGKVSQSKVAMCMSLNSFLALHQIIANSVGQLQQKMQQEMHFAKMAAEVKGNQQKQVANRENID